MMTQTQIDKLERLKRYGTRYEIVARKGNETLLIGYTGGRSRRNLLDMMRKNGPEVIAALGIGEDELIMFVRSGKGGAPYHAETSGWEIAFSGRTQREAIQDGEHVFVTKYRKGGAA